MTESVEALRLGVGFAQLPTHGDRTGGKLTLSKARDTAVEHESPISQTVLCKLIAGKFLQAAELHVVLRGT
jgi:hypothetical protein